MSINDLFGCLRHIEIDSPLFTEYEVYFAPGSVSDKRSGLYLSIKYDTPSFLFSKRLNASSSFNAFVFNEANLLAACESGNFPY